MRYLLTAIIGIGLNTIVFAQNVTLTNTQSHNAWGIPSISYTFDIDAHGISTREVIVNAYEQPGSSGAVVLTTGGYGNSFYSFKFGVEAQKLIDSLYTNGFEVYEIKWNDTMGWAENCEGIGSYHQAVGAYSVLVNHLHQNYFDNNNLVFASGNSGGSIQIAFGLAMFDLETIFDMVVLTGGPPISDLKTGIFGNGTEPEWWPNGLGGFALTDYLMGWTSQQYCVNRTAPQYIQDALDTVSLVSPVSNRDYDYSTFVNFVQSSDPTNADHQAEIYYDTISSSKDWYYLPSVNVHEVPESAEGSAKIRELILGYSPLGIENQTLIKNRINIYPNPTSGQLKIGSDVKVKDELKVSIYNLLGEKIMTIENQSEFEINDLTTGTYYLKIKIDDLIETKKIVKIE